MMPGWWRFPPPQSLVRIQSLVHLENSIPYRIREALAANIWLFDMVRIIVHCLAPLRDSCPSYRHLCQRQLNGHQHPTLTLVPTVIDKRAIVKLWRRHLHIRLPPGFVGCLSLSSPLASCIVMSEGLADQHGVRFLSINASRSVCKDMTLAPVLAASSSSYCIARTISELEVSTFECKRIILTKTHKLGSGADL